MSPQFKKEKTNKDFFFFFFMNKLWALGQFPCALDQVDPSTRPNRQLPKAPKWKGGPKILKKKG